MLNLARKLWHRDKAPETRFFSFDRPLVVIQSDDWGRVGVRDEEGYEFLRAHGILLGQNPYDFYTLETSDDVLALRDTLKRHRDSAGRSPCMVMNFLMANLDFDKMAESDFRKVHLLPLNEGLPGKWKRPGLFEAYKEGIAESVFYPALHGLTHFCPQAIENNLSAKDGRAALLRTLWRAETPYIYWRMPWVGYEYCNPEKPNAGFLPAGVQEQQIERAAKAFEKLFGKPALSACAPGYRANQDTHSAWFKQGIRVAQNGSGAPVAPHWDDIGILNLSRTIDIEPAQRDLPIEKYVQLADQCFSRGLPAVVSVHSINFHSSLEDFCTSTLDVLDEFLSALEARYSNLLYVHDGEVHELVNCGKLQAGNGSIQVNVKQESHVRAAALGAHS